MTLQRGVIATVLMLLTASALLFSDRVRLIEQGPRTLDATYLGRRLFTKSFTLHEGLGPHFNAASCSSCHHTPGVGGSGTRPESMVDWTFTDDADVLGAPAQRFALTRSGTTVLMPSRTRERRKAPALFGLGQLEAIPLDAVRSRIDPFDSDGDGISGRLPWREDCFGRFGWQSSVCDIDSFVTGALSRELGIESLPRSRREVSERDRLDLVGYVRNLPPPPAARSEGGEELFEAARCSTCHTPITGVATIRSERIAVHAYTDLLVHEMGTAPRHRERDSRTEFRTPPLWGVASTGPPYRHDGSARTVEEAILRHSGEAEQSQRIFVSLSRLEKRRLLDFVSSR